MQLFKKKNVTPLLSDADIQKLKEIERTAYMEEAEKLIKERGKARAKAELENKPQGMI